MDFPKRVLLVPVPVQCLSTLATRALVGKVCSFFTILYFVPETLIHLERRLPGGRASACSLSGTPVSFRDLFVLDTNLTRLSLSIKLRRVFVWISVASIVFWVRAWTDLCVSLTSVAIAGIGVVVALIACCYFSMDSMSNCAAFSGSCSTSELSFNETFTLSKVSWLASFFRSFLYFFLFLCRFEA
jgi:hypothetical protein